jgi:hypothetical protein
MAMPQLALADDRAPRGDVVAWGVQGLMAPPAGLGDVTAISAGARCALGLRASGTVVSWGGTKAGQCEVPAGLSGDGQ